MEYVAGQNIPLQGGDQLSPPILRFCETAGMPEGIWQRGRWYDVRPPLSGGSKYTMIPVMWTLYITGIMWSSDLCGVDPISHCCPVSNHSFSAHKNPATFL